MTANSKPDHSDVDAFVDWREIAETRLREIEQLRDGYCDEAYILMVQALDVKALGKGRRRILTAQARRMAKVGLGWGWPRPQGLSLSSRERLHRLANDVLAQTSPASDERRADE